MVLLEKREAQMRKLDKPYRRTHTMTFWWCDEKKLLSPMALKEREALANELIRCLTEVGFTITDDGEGKKDVYIRPFGEGYGFTGMVILSESHCSIHTYPEKKYGVLAEVEFNLCYLTSNHLPKLRAFAPLFGEFLRAERVTVQHSHRRYFTQA